MGGSWFTGGVEVLVVENGKVLIDGEEEEDGYYDKTNVFGHLSMKRNRIQLQSKNRNEIWAVTGSQTADSDCSAWNEYLEFMEKMKEARKNPPPGMFSLAQANQTEKPEASREIVCVDWIWTGDVRPPPQGMYSLAEVSGVGERTMHWLQKPPPSGDEVAALIEKAVFAMTAELLRLSPPRSSIEQKLVWASKATHKLLGLQDDADLKATQALLWKWINTSKFDLGMTDKLKGMMVQKIMNALIPLKKVVAVKPSLDDM